MTTSDERLVELSIFKKRTNSAQARKAVALFRFWHQRACKILAGLEKSSEKIFYNISLACLFENNEKVH